MRLGLTAFRAAVGATFFAHGAQKLFGWFGGSGLDGDRRRRSTRWASSPASASRCRRRVGGGRRRAARDAGLLTPLGAAGDDRRHEPGDPHRALGQGLLRHRGRLRVQPHADRRRGRARRQRPRADCRSTARSGPSGRARCGRSPRSPPGSPARSSSSGSRRRPRSPQTAPAPQRQRTRARGAGAAASPSLSGPGRPRRPLYARRPCPPESCSQAAARAGWARPRRGSTGTGRRCCGASAGSSRAAPAGRSWSCARRGQELPPLPDGVRVVEDAREGRGPLQGILAGLEAVDADVAFVASVDLPFLHPRSSPRCAAAADGADVGGPARRRPCASRSPPRTGRRSRRSWPSCVEAGRSRPRTLLERCGTRRSRAAAPRERAQPQRAGGLRGGARRARAARAACAASARRAAGGRGARVDARRRGRGDGRRARRARARGDQRRAHRARPARAAGRRATRSRSWPRTRRG